MTRRRPARRWQPQYLIVDETIADHETARAIIKNCVGSTLVRTNLEPGAGDSEILLRSLDIPSSRSTPQELTSVSRRSLLLWHSNELTQHMATGPAWERRCYNFIKIMPYIGTCTFNCSYCWFKDPVLIPRVNVTFFDQLPGLLQGFANHGQAPKTFTFTHYKTDCFGLEHLTGFCRRAADIFENYEEFNIQFLTKSSWVDSLLVDPIPASALVGFSINAREVTETVDLGTAPLEERLEAAARLSAAGIPVVLRLDPMMLFPGWQQSYHDLAGQVMTRFRPAQVTLGTPRFQHQAELETVALTTKAPAARAFMQKQVPLMGVTKPGKSQQTDSDRAYFKNMSVSYPDDDRRALYANAVTAFRGLDPTLDVGLCEEGADMWDAVGLPWTGDLTKDCSCNFLSAGARARLAPAHRRQLLLLQDDAIRNDSSCRSGT